MTIKKGEEWGRPVARPAGLRIAETDAELADMIAANLAAPLGVAGGDLYRSVGSPPSRDEMHCLPVDILEVIADDRHTIAVAHVVARRGWWRGRIIAACNVDRIGEWDVAPRAHPNDGRFDVVEVDPAMSVRQRWQARRRVVTGTHLPHPHIASRTATEREWTFDRAHPIWVDGRHISDARHLRVSIRPDAAEIHV